MNGRMAKKIRKEARAAAKKRDEEIFPEMKIFINSQSLWDRIRLAVRILGRRF